MPKTKHAKKPETSDSDSGLEDRRPVKKPKTVEKSKKSVGSDGEENSWEIGKNRFVKLTELKGKWYVNIREFYNADGELKPGKKGIMLTMEQWQAFKGVMPDLEDAIKENV